MMCKKLLLVGDKIDGGDGNPTPTFCMQNIYIAAVQHV